MELKIHPNDKMTPVDSAKAIAEKRDYDRIMMDPFLGENRYLALPAKDTNPEALENSSLDNKSVIVAL